MPNRFDPAKVFVSSNLPPSPPPLPVADSTRPSFKATLQTTNSSVHTVDAVTFLVEQGTTVEVSVLIEAHGAADSAEFYLHAAYRRAAGAPIPLTYVSAPNNSANTAGAGAWVAAIVLVGDLVTVTVRDPGGSVVNWNVEVQATIGSSGGG